MTINSNIYNQISTVFIQSPKKSYLHIIKNQDGTHAFEVNAERNSTLSLDIFKEMVGEDRFNRICAQKDLKFKANKPLSLTKDHVHKVLMSVMYIQKEDMDSLDGTTEERYQHLVLFDQFSTFEQACLKPIPSIESYTVDKAQGSGKGFKGLCEKASLLSYHHFSLMNSPLQQTQASIRDVELLTSRIGDREMQKGMVIHLHDGYFYVDAVFSGGGAYVTVLRDFDEIQPPKVVCRGTATRRGATEGLASGMNDILLEIGIEGVKSIWPSLSSYLSESNIQEVEIMGKSLGGAHAQELAILIEGIQKVHVKKLTTYCSVGVGKRINRLFHKEILKNRTTPFKLVVIRNGGNQEGQGIDYVPTIGGVHIGTKTRRKSYKPGQCDAKVIYINSEAEVQGIPLQEGKWNRLSRFIASFSAPHCKQNTLNDFHWTEIQGDDELNKHLRIGNKLEPVRKFFAHLFNFFTLGLVNGRSFKAYYKNLQD